MSLRALSLRGEKSIITHVRAPRLHFLSNSLTRLTLMRCCVWLAVSGSIDAQSTPTDGDSSLVPPAPQNHVLDVADQFREQPDTLVEFQEILLKME